MTKGNQFFKYKEFAKIDAFITVTNKDGEWDGNQDMPVAPYERPHPGRPRHTLHTRGEVCGAVRPRHHTVTNHA